MRKGDTQTRTRCADECEQHDDNHCQLCAEVLRECAQTCRNMAS